MNRKITVMIADDHQMVIRGLCDMLHDVARIKVVGTYGNGRELLTALKQTQPDVLILDIQMPEIAGNEAAIILKEEYPSIRILVLTNSDQIFDAQSMLQNGALGYLLKNTDPDTLVKAVETVHAGQQFIDPFMKEKLLEDLLNQRKETDKVPTLSRREQEILQLIVQEYTSQEIAEKLFLSQRTINNYRLNLLYKLEVKNTAGLVRKALSWGLVK